MLQPEQIVTVMRDLDWARTSPLSTGIRTELIDGDRRGHSGWGAGGGTVEHYEFRCPCGAGTIDEERVNIPGFREHDARIICGRCSVAWEFVPDLAVRQWRVRPIAAPAAA